MLSSRDLARVCGVIALLVGVALRVEAQGEQKAQSARTWEVVRRDCRTSISRQEITLFGNGTLRLKLRTEDKDELRLAELNPDEVQAYIRRLEDEDLSEVDEGHEEIIGSLIERCSLFLDLPDREPERYYFGRFDSMPLTLARLNSIVDDMFVEVEQLAPEGGLPRNYFPEPGDILERTDGHLFEVIALTSDRKGVELQGRDDPLTIFVALDSLRQLFVALVERREFP